MVRSLATAAALAILAALPGRAQYGGLATPANGSRVYFSTRLRQKGTLQPLWGKVFRVDQSGPALVEARDRFVPDPVPEGVGTGPIFAHPTNPFDLRAADVSADGSVVALGAYRECANTGSIYCYKMENYVTTISRVGKQAEYMGNLRLSANGEWAFGNGSHPVGPDDYPYRSYLVDLKRGTTFNLGPAGEASRWGRPVANDGTAVIADAAQRILSILQGGQTRQIVSGEPARDAVIDAGAKVVVWAVCPDYYCMEGFLRVASLPSGAMRVLVHDGRAPSLSDDGRTVLFLRGSEMWLIGVDGSAERRLAPQAASVTQAILSGDGSTVYAVTEAGALLRADAVSGAVEEIMPPTPSLAEGSAPWVGPNSLTTFKGSSLTRVETTATPPLPYTLGGIGIEIDGIPAKILSVTPSSVTVLAPPGLKPTIGGTAQVLLLASSSSPFETSTIDIPVYPEVAQVLADPVHQDWSALVTSEAPAAPGEILHTYVAGLGPTVPAVAYGDPAPAQPPFAVLATPYACTDGRRSIPVLWSGLAPGLAGVYQVDWRVPVDSAGILPISCSSITNPNNGFGQNVPVR